MIAGYCRTSVWKDHKVSIDSQQASIQGYISTDVGIEWFIDKGYSGSSLDRPAFNQLVDWVKRNDYPRKLYVSRYDRISRNMTDALNFLDMCHKHHVEVISVLEPVSISVGDKKATQLLFVQILFSLAEFTRSVTIENVNNGLVQKKAERKLLSVKPPFGYIYQDKTLIPHQRDSQVVQLIFTRYLTGQMGYKKIVKELNDKGILFHGKPFKTHHITNILKNPVYAGVVGDKSSNLESYKSDDITPIITLETFEGAKVIRQERQVSKRNTREYPLRQKIVCPFCQKRLTPKRQINQNQTYHYYICPTEGCKSYMVGADQIEQEVMNLVVHYVTQDYHIQLMIDELTKQIQKINEKKATSALLIKKQKDTLLSQFETGDLSHDEFKAAIDQLNHQELEIRPIDRNQERLRSDLNQVIKLSKTDTEELLWDYVEQVIVNECKQLKEVIVYGIRIKSRI